LDIENLIDFVKIPYKPIETIKYEDGIRFLGLNDISAMKLHAVSNRGTEAKDFVDIYYLLKHISLKDMFNNYKNKYQTENILNVKRSLVYFDDIKSGSWDSIRMIHDKVDIMGITTTLKSELNKYGQMGA
jgi:predicted nucleotidyltransferase component of viral defense system